MSLPLLELLSNEALLIYELVVLHQLNFLFFIFFLFLGRTKRRQSDHDINVMSVQLVSFLFNV